MTERTASSEEVRLRLKSKCKRQNAKCKMTGRTASSEEEAKAGRLKLEEVVDREQAEREYRGAR